jgi:cytochrome c-type biogenesis protein CcmH
MNPLPVFWALALALMALTLAVLVWPLLRRRTLEAPSEERARAAVYRDEKRQLDEELAAGALSLDDHAAAVRELTQRLGAELETRDADSVPARGERSAWITALAAVAIIPVGAIVLYLVFGTPDALRVAAHARPSDAEIVAMVEQLAAKMQSNPGDPRGWRLLGRSYVALGRYTEAADAFAQAAQHGADDADVYADWSEALALAHNRVVSGEPEALAQRALAKNPAHAKALALLATAALERRDFAASIDYWRRVAAAAAPGSEEAAQAAAAVAEVERMQKAAPAASVPAASGGSVSGRIDVAPELADRVQSGDTLFVYARAGDGARMPLAVSRTPAQRFPRDFVLDDTMGMGTGATLSSAGSVIVEARVSKSGDARPHTGDLAGQSAPVKPGTRDVHIVIDRVVP